MSTQTFETVLDQIAAQTKTTDADAAANLRDALQGIVAAGGVRHGLSASEQPIAEQAQAIVALGERCLASAFVTWSHRMTIEYVDRWGSAWLRDNYLEQLCSGERIGSTALATALADKSGKELLPITFEREGDTFVINGVIPWASNLYPDTLTVFAARNEATEERAVFAVTLDQPGIAVKPAGELLALNATASGTVKFEGLRLGQANLLTLEIDRFLGQMRPRFLVLQTAFCLGLIRASLAAIAQAPSATPFATDIAQFQAEADELAANLGELAGTLAEYPAPGDGHAPLPYLQLRLSAAQLAQAVTRVELASIGGRGYYRASDTSRRIRESLFLSVQAPTEGSLRWEISQLVP